jgi:hypothetical protein
MQCANSECKELVVRISEGYHPDARSLVPRKTDSWTARPRSVSRPLSDAIPADLRRDYIEAASILNISPRMSAVLARRILADVLERYAGLTQHQLSDRIDKFVADSAYPIRLRENLHHLREIANFGAHTQTGDQAQVIDVGEEEAGWTLDIIERLFDHFIIAPQRDEKMRAAMDKRIEEAGRRPISQPPDDSPTSI